MRKKILTFLVIIITAVSAFGAPVYAEEGDACSYGNFLGLRPWYQQLLKGDCKTIKDIGKDDSGDTVSIEKFVWTVAGNVATDVLLIVGYVAMVMIIYSGYLYMTSEGDATKMQKAKKGITGAVVGAFIGILGSAIVSFIVDIFM